MELTLRSAGDWFLCSPGWSSGSPPHQASDRAHRGHRRVGISLLLADAPSLVSNVHSLTTVTGSNL